MIYNNKSSGSSQDVRNLARLCIAKYGRNRKTVGGFVKVAALATVSAAALMLTYAPAAFAADQVAAAPAPATAAVEAAPEEIVVTGSRIVRDGYEAPTPVTVLSADDILTSDAPTLISDYLTKMPAFANSNTSRNSANSVGNSSSGQATLNLRAMGANRTLVLFDGLRIAPGSIGTGGGAVDVNGIPDALISRIDVVTGGASAAYGSDALAGVVNFVLDTKYTGVKGTLQGGTTIYNDDHEFQASLTGGTGFADDRGHFLISGTFTRIEGIDHGFRRKAIAEGYDQINNPAYTATNGLPFYTVTKNVGSGLYAPGGLITSGPLKGIDFGRNGSTRMFNYGALSNGGNQMVGGDWRYTTTSLQDASEYYTTSLDNSVWSQKFFTRVSYDITDDIHAYAQYMYSNNLSTANAYTATSSLTIRSGNPFIPVPVQTQMTALGLTSFVLGKSNYEDIGTMFLHNIRQLRQYTTGFDGKFDAFDQTWSWDAAYNRSETRQSTRTYNNHNKALLANAVDVVRNPTTGAPICRSTLTNPNDGCIPYNPMGIGMNTQEAIQYALNGVSKLNQSIVQNEYTVNVHGEPVSLWAGPVSLAVGFEYRDQGVVGFSSPLDDVNAFFAANYHPTNGSYSVAEGFVEALVPLAKDESWAKSLDLNAAIRETGYSTSGLVTTWKVGLTYDTPLTGFRVRGARSRDIRAPNLGELFSTGSPGQGNVVDAARGNVITTNVITITQGNPTLTPEKADTTNIGVVYQPEWLPGLSASVDWHHINIAGAIASLGAEQVVAQCFRGVTAFCSLVQRNSAGVLTLVNTAGANTAFYKQTGLDFEATYRQSLSDFSDSLSGDLTLHGLVTHYSDLTSVSPLGVVTQNAGVNGSSGAPSWRYVLNVQYTINDDTFSWTGRGISAGVINNNYTQCTSACPTLLSPRFTIDNNRLPSVFYMDASYTHKFVGTAAGDFDIFLNVENLMNKQNNFFAPTTAGNDVYEKLGTTFRSGIRFQL